MSPDEKFIADFIAIARERIGLCETSAELAAFGQEIADSMKELSIRSNQLTPMRPAYLARNKILIEREAKE